MKYVMNLNFPAISYALEIDACVLSLFLDNRFQFTLLLKIQSSGLSLIVLDD